jgi:hypothetical protein
MCTEPKLTGNWHSRADTLSLPLLPACVFVIRDTVRHPRRFRSENLFVNRGVREPRFHCIPDRGNEYVSSSKFPDWLWLPPSLLLITYQGLFLHLHIPFFRCLVLTNMCVYVRSNTTVILDGVLFAIGYMFRPLLCHHQVILEVCYL